MRDKKTTQRLKSFGIDKAKIQDLRHNCKEFYKKEKIKYH